MFRIYAFHADPDPGLPITKFGDIKYEYFDIFHLFIIEGSLHVFIFKKYENTYTGICVKIHTLDLDPHF